MPYIGNQPAPTNVTSTNITDGTITNADINANAAIALTKLDNVTATNTELNILDGATVTTAELNTLDGITATVGELNILDGVTSNASELNLLDGSTAGTIVNSKGVVYGSSGEVNATTLQIGGTSITSTAAELNYNDITTLGTSEASKVLTADANGDVVVSEEFTAKSYNETYVSLTAAATVDVDCETGNYFALSTGQNTTFTFSNPPASGTGFVFILEITQGGAYTLTWPAAVAWAGGAAPDAPGSGEVAVYAFATRNGGTTWYGFQAGTALA